MSEGPRDFKGARQTSLTQSRSQRCAGSASILGCQSIETVSLATAGYALFQAANNTEVMGGVGQAERGLVSGLLNLARNLGLVSGASLMGAVFAFAGMRVTFAFAAVLMLVAIGLVASRRTMR